MLDVAAAAAVVAVAVAVHSLRVASFLSSLSLDE